MPPAAPSNATLASFYVRENNTLDNTKSDTKHFKNIASCHGGISGYGDDAYIFLDLPLQGAVTTPCCFFFPSSSMNQVTGTHF